MIHPVPKPIAKERTPKPLQRHKRINRRRTRERRGPARDKAYRKLVITLPCAGPGCNAPPPSQPSHLGGLAAGKGAGMKVSDYRCAPHCDRCHKDYEQRKGVFGRMTDEQRAAYETEAIHETLHLLGYEEREAA